MNWHNEHGWRSGGSKRAELAPAGNVGPMGRGMAMAVCGQSAGNWSGALMIQREG